MGGCYVLDVGGGRMLSWEAKIMSDGPAWKCTVTEGEGRAIIATDVSNIFPLYSSPTREDFGGKSRTPIFTLTLTPK